MRLLAAPFESLSVDPASTLPGKVVSEIGESNGWPAVIDVCRRWRLIPALETHVTRAQLRLPSTERMLVRREAVGQFARTSVCLRSGCEAIHSLQNAGIKVVAFKGLAIIGLLHGGAPQHRMIQDVDILISKNDLLSALKLLQSRGYRPSVEYQSIEEYIAFLGNSPGAAGNQAISLSSPQGHALDLHWKLGKFQTDDVFSMAQTVKILGFEIPVVRSSLGLLLTAHHALRNDLVPDEIGRDVLDCQGWFRLLADMPGEFVQLTELANRLGFFDVVQAMSLILQQFGGRPLFAEASVGRVARDLAALYQYQLEFWPLNTDLTYLGDRRAVRQVLSGALTGWGKYVRYMRAFESFNGEQPLSLGKRTSRLVRSAKEMPLAQWQQVRALSRVKRQTL